MELSQTSLPGYVTSPRDQDGEGEIRTLEKTDIDEMYLGWKVSRRCTILEKKRI